MKRASTKKVPSSNGVKIMHSPEVQNLESFFERCNNRIEKVKIDEVVRN